MGRKIECPWLGARNYLHGTTLFDALVADVPAGASLSFKIAHRMDSDRTEVVPLSEATGSPSATLHWREGARQGGWAVYPSQRSPEPKRANYPEAVAVSAAEFHAGTCSVALPVGDFTFIQTLIALNKELLRREAQPSSPGQWFFTRLDVPRLPMNQGQLRLSVAQSLPGILAKTALELDGQPLGELYFSWVRQ